MNLVQRLTATITAKANALLDRYDDPSERLDYAYQLLSEQLGAARQAAMRVEAADERLAAEATRLEECNTGLNVQARKASSTGQDDQAREALARCRVIKRGMELLVTERHQITEEDDRFIAAVGHLEDKLAVFAAKKEVLKGVYAATRDKAGIDEAVSQMRDDVANVGIVVARADATAAQLNAQCQRILEQLASGVLLDLTSSPESIRSDLDAARRSEEVERELAAIKRG